MGKEPGMHAGACNWMFQMSEADRCAHVQGNSILTALVSAAGCCSWRLGRRFRWLWLLGVSLRQAAWRCICLPFCYSIDEISSVHSLRATAGGLCGCNCAIPASGLSGS